MGKPQSKSQDGNTNINIEEHLENNEINHAAHEIKLWLILGMNIFQILYLIHSVLKKKWERKAFNRARMLSQDQLDSVQVNKWMNLVTISRALKKKNTELFVHRAINYAETSREIVKCNHKLTTEEQSK